MTIKRIILAVVLLFFAVPLMAGVGTRGIFVTSSGVQTFTVVDSATANTDTLTGYLITFSHSASMGGDFTIVIKSTLNSGAYTTNTVSVRKYYDADLGYGSWFDVGTFDSDGTHEFNVASYSSWYFCLGYQIRVTAASGTFNITLIGKAFNR